MFSYKKGIFMCVWTAWLRACTPRLAPSIAASKKNQNCHFTHALYALCQLPKLSLETSLSVEMEYYYDVLVMETIFSCIRSYMGLLKSCRPTIWYVKQKCWLIGTPQELHHHHHNHNLINNQILFLLKQIKKNIWWCRHMCIRIPFN